MNIKQDASNELFWSGKINGRFQSFEYIKHIKKQSCSSVIVTDAGNRQYEVWGGSLAGGAVNEWYIEDRKSINKAIECTSLIDALRVINCC